MKYKNSKNGFVVDSKIDLDGVWVPLSEAKAGRKEKSETPDDTWTLSELKGFAEERDIDLGEATRKDDVVAAITSALESASVE